MNNRDLYLLIKLRYLSSREQLAIVLIIIFLVMVVLQWFVDGGCPGDGGERRGEVSLLITLQLWGSGKNTNSTNPWWNASKSRAPQHINRKEENNKDSRPKTARGLNNNAFPKTIHTPQSHISGE